MAIGRKLIGERLPGPNKMRMGDVVAVPLGDGYWGYVREAKERLQILNAVSQNELLPLKTIVGCEVIGWMSCCELWDRPTWIYLGKWRFADQEDSYGPPRWMPGSFNSELPRIYHRGELVDATSEHEVQGMDRFGFETPGDLVIKVRQLHGLDFDRALIERFAPFSDDWNPPDEDPSERAVWPDVFTCEQPKKLSEVKALYPFPRWRQSGLSQYTEKACARFVAIFDHLLEDLIALGENGSEARKLAAFEEAVKSLNKLSRRNDSLIETMEREELCQLCNLIAVAAGLQPENYGDGEGPASEWREW